MTDRPRRKRVSHRAGNLLPVEDALAYDRNRCSPKARKIKSSNPGIVFELWFDKHYYDRYHFGDDEGHRPGIEPLVIEELVTRSFEHLITYSTSLESFSFINEKRPRQGRKE